MVRNGKNGRPGAVGLRLRALAHPLRWRLLDLISGEGSATATKCAEVTGESVASCAYHLGVLGKYGYLEQVRGLPGREKPWRATGQLRDDLSGTGQDAEGEHAARAVAEAFLGHEMERMQQRLRQANREPAEWRATSLMGSSVMYVTPAELGQLTGELQEILRRFEDRVDDPARRPAGARAARVFVSAYPEPPR
ncbi:MAG TPA: helix-turn-helix domain-containing protein [Streptosporangiaceae bacterium]|jgi:hypothetical protein